MLANLSLIFHQKRSCHTLVIHGHMTKFWTHSQPWSDRILQPNEGRFWYFQPDVCCGRRPKRWPCVCMMNSWMSHKEKGHEEGWHTHKGEVGAVYVGLCNITPPGTGLGEAGPVAPESGGPLWGVVAAPQARAGRPGCYVTSRHHYFPACTDCM